MLLTEPYITERTSLSEAKHLQLYSGYCIFSHISFAGKDQRKIRILMVIYHDTHIRKVL